MLLRRTSVTTLAALLLGLGSGASSLGKASHEITAFDYTGTARTSRADALIRVLLQGDTGADTLVWESFERPGGILVTLSYRVG